MILIPENVNRIRALYPMIHSIHYTLLSMFLSEIWIYPVKSLGGIRLTESQVREKGLQYDRRWMIVDEKGKFLTQRVNSKMALLDVSFHTDGLILSLTSG
jgi:uncharacterized protein YcbX